jgi:hypothetical protein
VVLARSAVLELEVVCWSTGGAQCVNEREKGDRASRTPFYACMLSEAQQRTGEG